MSTNKKIGIVGCGPISSFHVDALRSAGMTVSSVCGSDGSTTVAGFAEKHGIPEAHKSLDDLLNRSSELDALLIAVPPSVTVEVVKNCAAADVPMLVEKPVAMQPGPIDELAQFDDRILVAYNRRYYPSVRFAKDFINRNPECVVTLTIPESISHSDSEVSDVNTTKNFFSNSVHGIDLVNYLLGPLSLERVEQLGTGDVPSMLTGIGRAGDSLVIINCNWNSPANFALNIDHAGTRLELRPWEIASLYEGMEVSEPTEARPVRTYTPKLIETVDSLGEGLLKPGFGEQAQAFAAFMDSGERDGGATLSDAQKATQLATELVGFEYPGD
jgi:predicted dehydrogenase